MNLKNLFFSIYIIFALALLFSCKSKAKVEEAATVYVKDDKGIEQPVIAASAQAIVFFKNSQFENVDEQKQIIKECGGKIIKHIPEINYYLVKTKKRKETEFVENIIKYQDVKNAYVNQISNSNSISIDIIDDFTHPTWTGYIHGKYVENSAKSVCNNCFISIPHDVEGLFSDATMIETIHNIFTVNTDKTAPILINMSFGQYIFRMKKMSNGRYEFIKEENSNGEYREVTVMWEERDGYSEDLWNKERENWAYRYKIQLLKLAEWLANYSDREFIVTKSAGNNGCHKLDSCILHNLQMELYRKQFENAKITKILDERIILVSAKDNILHNGHTANNTPPKWWKINGEYADRPKTYHKWVTTLDISHLTYPNSSSIDGTSFSAPLLLGHIARLFSIYGFCSENSESAKGITVKEMVTLIKKITEEDAKKNGHPGLLDTALLNNKMNNLHLDFAETIWELVYIRGMLGCTFCSDTECNCTIEFLNNGRFRQTGITINGEKITDEGTYSYKGIMDDTPYSYPKYSGWGREKIFGEVGDYYVVGYIQLRYDPYAREKYIKVLDRPISTPNGQSALLEVDDHRTIGCTMWFNRY